MPLHLVGCVRSPLAGFPPPPYPPPSPVTSQVLVHSPDLAPRHLAASVDRPCRRGRQGGPHASCCPRFLRLPYPTPDSTTLPVALTSKCTTRPPLPVSLDRIPSHCRSGLGSQGSELFKHHQHRLFLPSGSPCSSPSPPPAVTRPPSSSPERLLTAPQDLCTRCPSRSDFNPRILSRGTPSMLPCLASARPVRSPVSPAHRSYSLQGFRLSSISSGEQRLLPPPSQLYSKSQDQCVVYSK